MMKKNQLDRITFTGADDSVDPAELVNISEEYPIVEWGILFSDKNAGIFRFPSFDWLDRLYQVHTRSMKLSAHLCGQYVRDTVVHGEWTWEFKYRPLLRLFQRIQLNFHGQFHRSDNRFVALLDDFSTYDWILQCDSVNDATAKKLASESRVVPLFDTSGGAGVVPDEWPEAWKGVYCGYAGGLGPETIREQLPLIAKRAGDQPFWIDMEALVRSNDDAVFDLTKVRAVLEATRSVFWV